MIGNLFLYETEEQVDVKHVIVLQHYVTCVVRLCLILFNVLVANTCRRQRIVPQTKRNMSVT
jgi:hypothetical protein